MNKSPAFQWYPRDILSSARVQMMTLAEEGAYRRLIDYCWLNEYVPADAQKAARLIGKGCSPEIAKVALEMFTPHPTEPEKMIHDRLESERDKQKHNSEARQKAAEARWNKQGTSKNGNGKQAKSTTDANALQTDMQNDALHLHTTNKTNQRTRAEIKETQTEYLARKQVEYPKLDVQAVFLRYLRFCKDKGMPPKRRFFDDWLDNEDEPMTASFDKLKSPEELQREREEIRKTQARNAPIGL